ncbi:hypothetical protein BH09BAC1_BH09BAC1_27570 [soil metagenome]
METQKHIWEYAIPNEIARNSIRGNWAAALEHRRFSIALVITLTISGIIMCFLPYYFSYIQARPGLFINDPILALFVPVDVSVYIFALLYISVVMCIGYVAYFPKYFLKAAWGYSILTCLRMIVMLFVPLEAPPEMIFLLDPILNIFIYQEISITKDLFFSGHTATMFILACGVPNKTLKTLFLLGGVVMASLLLMQHIHYTIDILVAPFFAYVSWKLAERIEHKVFGSISTVAEQ